MQGYPLVIILMGKLPGMPRLEIRVQIYKPVSN